MILANAYYVPVLLFSFMIAKQLLLLIQQNNGKTHFNFEYCLM